MFCETFEKINTDINIKNNKSNNKKSNNKKINNNTINKNIKNINEIQSDFIIFNPSTNNNNNFFMNRLKARSVFYNLK